MEFFRSMIVTLTVAACAVGMTMAVTSSTDNVVYPNAEVGVSSPGNAETFAGRIITAPPRGIDPGFYHAGHVDDVTGSDAQSDKGKCTPAEEHCSSEAPATTPIPTAPTDQDHHSCQAAGQPGTSPVPSSQEPAPAPSSPVRASTQVSDSPTCGPDGTAGILPIAPPKCTINATNASQVNSAKAGDTVCFSGSSLAGSPLNITTSGTDGAPITIAGDGKTPVKGIRVNANNVVVQGFSVIGAAAPGVQLKGGNLTLQSTKIDHPTGGDYDGIRYFGDGIKILHNHILNITNTGGAHADCMQTYATTTPTSHSVLISGNRCEKIDNQCLIAQGPHSKAGDGSGKGESSGLTFSNNYCDAHASQAVHIDDVQNVTLMSNDIQGKVQKAFNFINKSTGVKVGCNKLGPGVGNEVMIDKSSKPGD